MLDSYIGLDATRKRIAERQAAQTALEQALARVLGIEQAGASVDAESVLLGRLGVLKRAVVEGAGAAPDTAALGNVVGDIRGRGP